MEKVDIKKVSRIVIIGGPGTGKSTLSKNLSKVLNIPNYHIDSFNYKDNWVERDKKERDEMVLNILDNEKWIIDGTYRSTLEERLKKSELVIFLDYNTFAKLKGIVLRYINGKGKEKFDIPGCKEKLDFEFIKFTLKWNKNKRKDIFKYLNLENNMYIFPDKTINPTYSIKSLYEDILKEERELPLYEKFIQLEEEKDEDLQEDTIENQKKHLGQMGGIYGLSESQRESINNFNNIKEGEILAVKGPPGTGKTTLIQSIVANEYVKRALKKDEPPLIVASSTNNQAVTNIIESFGKIKRKFKQNNLEERWIENVDSFAIYFPSKNKRKQAKEKNFQYTDNRGNFFAAEIEKEENIKNLKKNL